MNTIACGDIYEVGYPFKTASGQYFALGDKFEVEAHFGNDYRVVHGQLSLVLKDYEIRNHCRLYVPNLPKGKKIVAGDDWDLFGSMDFGNQVNAETTVKCECGQIGVTYAIHSDYCPMYEKPAKN